MTYIREDSGSLILSVYVQPKAAKNSITGLHGDAVKVCITAPPVDGKANAALGKFLAKLLGIPKSAVTVQSGGQSRHKRLRLSGVTLADAEAALNTYLAGP